MRKTKYEIDKKWNENNRERRRYLSARSSARSFINTKATLEDLYELQVMLESKIEELEKKKKI